MFFSFFGNDIGKRNSSGPFLVNHVLLAEDQGNLNRLIEDGFEVSTFLDGFFEVLIESLILRGRIEMMGRHNSLFGVFQRNLSHRSAWETTFLGQSAPVVDDDAVDKIFRRQVRPVFFC